MPCDPNLVSSAFYTIIVAERISARQYKSGSILGIYVRMYVRSSAQARTSRRSLRRRRSLDVYARARRQYRLGAYRKLGSCETPFIAFEPITQDVSQLPRPLFDSGRNVTRVCVHMHACVRGVPRVCVCMHAHCVDWYGLEMVGTYVRRRRPWPARGKICACAFLVRNDDASFTRGKRVNEEIILCYTSSRKTSYHAKFQAQCLHGLPVLT